MTFERAFASFLLPLALILILNSMAAEANPTKDKVRKMQISKERALDTAAKAGFFATWTTVELRGSDWHFFGYSKSAMPAMYFVVSGADGQVTYKNTNSDFAKVPIELKRLKATESYSVDNSEPRVWTKDQETGG